MALGFFLVVCNDIMPPFHQISVTYCLFSSQLCKELLLHGLQVELDVLPQVGLLVLARLLKLIVQLDQEQLFQQLEIFSTLLTLLLDGSLALLHIVTMVFALADEIGKEDDPLERGRKGGLFIQKLCLKLAALAERCSRVIIST